MINMIIFYGLLTFGLTLILVPFNIKFSLKNGFIAHPNDRTIHADKFPHSGGLSFALPIILFETVLLIFKSNHLDNVQFRNLILGSLLILITGLLDDRKNISARHKFILQVIIVSLMYFLGNRITNLTNPFGPELELGLLSFPFTLFWYLIIINAMNLIDGMDGLAAGITIIVCGVLTIAGFKYQNFNVILPSILLLSGCLGFLRYNFYPASIFMGDTGSLFIGFQLATISIIGVGQLKGVTAMTLLIPVTVLFIPIFDTLSAITRRIKKKKNIFHADKEHIHHRLLDIGFSQRMVFIITVFITFLFSLISLGYMFNSKKIMIVLLILIAVVLGFSFYYLLKKEFFK